MGARTELEAEMRDPHRRQWLLARLEVRRDAGWEQRRRRLSGSPTSFGFLREVGGGYNVVVGADRLQFKFRFRSMLGDSICSAAVERRAAASPGKRWGQMEASGVTNYFFWCPVQLESIFSFFFFLFFSFSFKETIHSPVLNSNYIFMSHQLFSSILPPKNYYYYYFI